MDANEAIYLEIAHLRAQAAEKLASLDAEYEAAIRNPKFATVRCHVCEKNFRALLDSQQFVDACCSACETRQ